MSKFIEYIIYPDGTMEIEALRGVTIKQVRECQVMSMDAKHYTDGGCRCGDTENMKHIVEH